MTKVKNSLYILKQKLEEEKEKSAKEREFFAEEKEKLVKEKESFAEEKEELDNEIKKLSYYSYQTDYNIDCVYGSIDDLEEYIQDKIDDQDKINDTVQYIRSDIKKLEPFVNKLKEIVNKFKKSHK